MNIDKCQSWMQIQAYTHTLIRIWWFIEFIFFLIQLNLCNIKVLLCNCTFLTVFAYSFFLLGFFHCLFGLYLRMQPHQRAYLISAIDTRPAISLEGCERVHKSWYRVVTIGTVYLLHNTVTGYCWWPRHHTCLIEYTTYKQTAIKN